MLRCGEYFKSVGIAACVVVVNLGLWYRYQIVVQDKLESFYQFQAQAIRETGENNVTDNNVRPTVMHPTTTHTSLPKRRRRLPQCIIMG